MGGWGVPALRLVSAASIVAACLALLMVGSSAVAHHSGAAASQRPSDAARPWIKSGLSTPAAQRLVGRSTFSAPTSGQHGAISLHLPAVRENVELVGKLEVNTPEEFRFDPETGEQDDTEPPVVEGQIADVAVYKNAAYLASWAEPSCKRGGFFSVDISNPAQPRQLAFVPALEDTYHGEGMHVVTFNGRDILAANNEPCGANGVGGFDLYDVTDPANPVTLVQGYGDQSPTEDDFIALGSVTQDPNEVPNSNHSIFLWEDRGKLYAVIVDNTELNDVDIFDVTNPSAPQFIADIDLDTLAFDQNFDIYDSSNSLQFFHHDMVVKKIGNVQTMLISYWDHGYVKLNVNNPTNPVLIGDSDFGTTDPLTGAEPPEGNGHQAEFSHDNEFVLAADEDFAPYRAGNFEITSGPNAGEYEASEVPGGTSVTFLPDLTLNGPVVYGGYGCPDLDGPGGDPGSKPIPPRSSVGLPPLATGEEAIVVLQRGPTGDPENPEAACFPGQKAANAIAAGYDAVLIVNRHPGADGAACGSGGFPSSPPIVTLCTTHDAFHRLFGETPSAEVPYPPGHGPDLGQVGEKVTADSVFDGWGYTHLYRNVPGGDLEPIDHFSIEEGLDPRYAFGFGDLSVHEFATDPNVNLAYSAYYAGGMRVFQFGDDGLEQTGKFIDEGGNNFWGVEVVTTSQGERLFAGSDRDFGLYLLRYTGPGAVPKPSPQGGGQAPPPVTAQSVRLSDLQIPGQSLRVGKKRYVRVPVSCPETVGGDCRGHLTIERRNGWHTLSQRWFTKDADELSSVRLRIARPEFRRLVARGRQRVSVELISRGSDGVLRHAEQHLTLLAPRTARG
jgi:hypothetical protein